MTMPRTARFWLAVAALLLGAAAAAVQTPAPKRGLAASTPVKAVRPASGC